MRIFMKMLGVVGLMLSIGLSAEAAMKATIPWTYTQNPQRPATGFVLQRCIKVGTTACAMVDIATVPVTQFSYDDLNLNENTIYCHQIAALDAAGRGTFTAPQCGGFIELNVPGMLAITYTKQP